MAQIQGGERSPTPSCGPPCGQGGPGRTSLRSVAPLRSHRAWSPAQSSDPPTAQQPCHTHLQLGGRGRQRAVLHGAPPADSARAARPGRERTRTRAAVSGRASCGLSTRLRVLLTNSPGARGGRRRGSPVRGPARPWSPSAPQGRRCLLRSPPSLAPPKPARRRSARPRRAGAGRAAGGERRAARLELVADWKEGAEADPGSGLQAGRAPASPTFHQSQTAQRSR